MFDKKNIFGKLNTAFKEDIPNLIESYNRITFVENWLFHKVCEVFDVVGIGTNIIVDHTIEYTDNEGSERTIDLFIDLVDFPNETNPELMDSFLFKLPLDMLAACQTNENLENVVKATVLDQLKNDYIGVTTSLPAQKIKQGLVVLANIETEMGRYQYK